MDARSSVSYKQPIKQKARSEALAHAVKLLTTRRKKAAIAPNGYVRFARERCKSQELWEYQDAALSCSEDDVSSWEGFHNSMVGSLKAKDLTIAYLAGPEPTNDILTLINLGVSAQNIWAFEISNSEFEKAIRDVRDSSIRGVKLVKMKMEEYFASTPRRFDIIYFDACATFPSNEQKTLQTVAAIFRHSALNPLGVLITNFSAPDTSKVEDLESYSHLIASYLYPKRTVDATYRGAFFAGSSAEEDSLMPSREIMSSYVEDDDDDDELLNAEDEYFLDKVKENFDFYYGSFITRQIMDLGSIIAPIDRMLKGRLWNNLFVDKKLVFEGAKKLMSDGDEADVVHEGSSFSLIRTMLFLDVYDGKEIAYPEPVKKFLRRWVTQLVDCDGEAKKAVEMISAFYACRGDKSFWKEGMTDVRDFDYQEHMPQLCDVPTEDLGFYPIFAQFAYPSHLNVREVKRFSYVAEGKSNKMFLDVLPFDECRYIYDWLSSGHLVGGDLEAISTQLTFRFALDALVKNIHDYQEDYLFGGHALPLSEYEQGALAKRVDLNKFRNKRVKDNPQAMQDVR